jgi:hypothetical protein
MQVRRVEPSLDPAGKCPPWFFVVGLLADNVARLPQNVSYYRDLSRLSGRYCHSAGVADTCGGHYADAQGIAGQPGIRLAELFNPCETHKYRAAQIGISHAIVCVSGALSKVPNG